MTRTALLVVAVLGIGCAARAPAPPLVFGERPPPGCLPSAPDARCFGWILDRALVAIAVTEVPDDAVNRYVTGVGLRLARAGGVTMPLQFRVIDDLDAEAESFVGGAIYVHRGALLRLRSEAELAGLLGHEIGHAVAGHASVGGGPLGIARDDEIQADELAVRLTAAAGYDPRAVETMLRAIAAEEPAACVEDRAAHPCMRDRLARIRARIGGRTRGALGVESFRAGLATLVTGEDPRRVTATPTALVFGHAGLALAPAGAQTLQAIDGRGMAVLADGAVVVVTAVPRELGVLLRASPPAGQAFAVGVHGALWILVASGPGDATARAAAVARLVHPAAAAELPPPGPRFEPTAPRALWPR